MKNKNNKNLNDDLCKKDDFKHETIFDRRNILKSLQHVVKINKWTVPKLLLFQN